MRQVKREQDAGKLDVRRGLRATWQDATFKHLSGYILLRCFNGEPCQSIALELNALNIQISERTIRTYLRDVLRGGADGYNCLKLKPKKRGPSRDLSTSMAAELTWTSKRALQSWHFWPLAEITFYLQCGICPPNRYKVVQGDAKLRTRIASEFTHAWFLRATALYIEEGRLSDDMLSCLAKADTWLRKLDPDADKPKSRLIRRTKNTGLVSKGPSREYVGKLLAELGYEWKRPSAFLPPRWTKRAVNSRKTKASESA